MSQPQQPDYVGGLPAGCLLNEYQIERVLGHGGFGVTYLARDTMLQKSVALKEYLPMEWAIRSSGNTVTVRSSSDRQAFEQGLTSFLNEARVLARFNHPNLIPVYRFFQANNTAYFVMDYAEGDTLKAVIKKNGGLPEDEIKRLLIPVLKGLEGVHKAGILHRDIKPENILVRNDGSAILIDFGAARYAMGSKSRAITSVLTAGYAPIEQYSTSSQQGPWTDIYAMGAVMYYAIAGRKPIDAVARIHDDPHVTATLAGKDRYSPEFLNAVDWALRVRAEERPQSVADWCTALEGIQLAPEFAPAPAVAEPTRAQPTRPAPTIRHTAAPAPTVPSVKTVPVPPPPAPSAHGGVEPTVLVARAGGPSMTVQNAVLAPVARAPAPPPPVPVSAPRAAVGRGGAAVADPDSVGTITLRRSALFKAGGAIGALAIAIVAVGAWWFARGKTTVAPPPPAPAVVQQPQPEQQAAPAPAPHKAGPSAEDLQAKKQRELDEAAARKQKELDAAAAQKRQADEAAAAQKRQAEEQALRQKAADEEAQRQAAAREKQRQDQLDARRKADEEGRQKAADDARRKQEALEAKRKEEAARQKAAQEQQEREAEAARQKAAEEEAARQKQQQAAQPAAPKPQTAAEKREAARQAKIAEKQRRAEEKKKQAEANKDKDSEDSAVGF